MAFASPQNENPDKEAIADPRLSVLADRVAPVGAITLIVAGIFQVCGLWLERFYGDGLHFDLVWCGTYLSSPINQKRPPFTAQTIHFELPRKFPTIDLAR